MAESKYRSQYITKLFITFICIDSMLFEALVSSSQSLNWEESSVAIPQIPAATNGMALGAYNGSVWLFQIYYDPQWNPLYDIIEIDLTTGVGTTHNPSITIPGSWGQAYFQSKSVVFMTDKTFNSIIGYDLRSHTKVYDIPKYDTVYDNALCIVGNDEYLFSIGGAINTTHKTNAVYIYDFHSSQWRNGTSLPQSRNSMGCNILHHHLYIISGHTVGSVPLSSILFIAIKDLNRTQSSTWNIFPQSLSFGRTSLRSIVYHEFIFVVGGSNGSACISNVDVIDTVNNVIIEESPLLYPKCRPSVVIVRDILYSFGGYPTTRSEYYQYAAISTRFTTNPSAAPSKSSTANPSALPTTNPSTNSPSVSPTANPLQTASPTAIPLQTTSPTAKPLQTSLPTANPLKLSTPNPSVSPSNNPLELSISTKVPTGNPLQTLTANPSVNSVTKTPTNGLVVIAMKPETTSTKAVITETTSTKDTVNKMVPNHVIRIILYVVIIVIGIIITFLACCAACKLCKKIKRYEEFNEDIGRNENDANHDDEVYRTEDIQYSEEEENISDGLVTSITTQNNIVTVENEDDDILEGMSTLGVDYEGMDDDDVIMAELITPQ